MYRYLEVGETIQEGDEGTALCNRSDLSKMSDEEFLNSEDKRCGWQKCNILTGQKIKTNFALHCRRKIVPEVKFYRTISGNYIRRHQDNKCDYFIPEQNMFSTSCGWSHIHDRELKNGYYTEISEDEYVRNTSTETLPKYYADKNCCVKKYTDEQGQIKKDIITFTGVRFSNRVWSDVDTECVANSELIETTEQCFDYYNLYSNNLNSQQKGTAMNPEKQTIFNIDTTTPIGKTVQAVKTYGFKAANYFVFEPAVHIGKPILKSIRYILFVGGLTAAVYGINNPELVSNTVKSCLPKVSIQAPDILR